jgi:leader peptidase (prepilin peptidase)/N-methyltransferase
MSALPPLAAVCGATIAAAIDARTGYIPDRVTCATALLALAFAAVAGEAETALRGGAALGIAMGVLYAITRGRGLGLGDVKLAAAIGLGFGPGAGMLAVGAAFVLGGAYAVWLLVTRRARRGDAVRFGPFLAAGAFAAAIARCGVAA